MILKNNSGKIIGIGADSLLPGETKPCPVGYEKNPVIKQYIKRGILERQDPEETKEPADTKEVVDQNESGEQKEPPEAKEPADTKETKKSTKKGVGAEGNTDET